MVETSDPHRETSTYFPTTPYPPRERAYVVVPREENDPKTCWWNFKPNNCLEFGIAKDIVTSP